MELLGPSWANGKLEFGVALGVRVGSIGRVLGFIE